jgi:O-antigen/teichoic acid export membrane protein
MSTDELTTIAQKAARGGLFLFIGNTSSTVILAVGAIIVARLLSPFGYGLYTLTIAIPTLLVALSDAGMNLALVRLPARARSEGDHARANRLIRLGFLFKLAVSTVAFLLCYAGSTVISTIVLNRPELAPFIQLASLMIVFQAIYDATSNAFIGQDLMQYSAATQIMQAVLKGTLGPALVLIGWGITGAISGYLLSLAAAGATGASILFSRYARLSTQITDSASTRVRELLGYGLPLYVATILSVFLSQYQNIVLAHFASNVEIGNFAASWTFTTLMAVLSYPIATAMFPMFSKMDPKNQKGDLSRGFILAVKYTSLLMIPASVAVMVFSRDLIYLTFGRGYTSAPQYLALLSVLYLLAAIGSVVLGSFLNGVAETGTVVKMSGLTLAVYLPLGPALAWFWSAYGVLVAYILSNAVSTLYGIRESSMKYDAGPDLRASGRIFVASLVAAVPVIALIELHLTGVGLVNLLFGGLLYVFMYLTVAPILGAVDKFDVANLGTILSFAPLQYPGVEMRFAAAAELGQNPLEQNILEIATLEGNVLDLRLIRSRARLEERDGKKVAARTYTLMTRTAAALIDSVLDYEARLLSAVNRD